MPGCCTAEGAAGRKKAVPRSEKEQKELVTRLNRIEGQIRGIRGMIEDSRYCVDVLVQVSAVQSALQSFGRELLCSHIRSCVADDIRNGGEDAVEELVMLLQKTMR